MLSTQVTYSTLKNYLTPDVPRLDTKKQSRQSRPELAAITQGSCFKDWKEKTINTKHSVYFPRKVSTDHQTQRMTKQNWRPGRGKNGGRVFSQHGLAEGKGNIHSLG